jgi:hypothetical protein
VNFFSTRSRSWRFYASVCVVFATAFAIAQGIQQSGPPSLYKPELARPLGQSERWQLDFELANEASMKDHNSYRFDAPGSFDKRARWVEATAQWYMTADLLQQMIDFRKSAMRNNEHAFNQLFELGKQGDVGAACTAARFYRYHRKEVTARWKYSFEQVAREALKYKDSGNPVCFGLEGSLYLYGDLGYPSSRKQAKPDLLRSAVAGSFGDQVFLANMHHFEAQRFEPEHVALKLCWTRAASYQSPAAFFREACDGYRLGIAFDINGKEVAMPQHIQQLGRQWCTSERIVTAATCAALEQKLDSEEK